MTYPKDFLDGVAEKVAEYGHMIQYVGADTERGIPPFAYTVGLLDRWGHELVIVGFGPDTVIGVLNAAVESYPDGPPAGAAVPRIIRAPYMVAVLEPAPADDRFPPNVARAWSGRTDVAYAQIVLPDAHYRYPWHKSYENPAAQPVLGTPPPRH